MGNEIGNKIIEHLPLNIDALGVHTIMSSHDNVHIYIILFSSAPIQNSHTHIVNLK